MTALEIAAAGGRLFINIEAEAFGVVGLGGGHRGLGFRLEG